MYSLEQIQNMFQAKQFETIINFNTKLQAQIQSLIVV